MRTAYRPRFTSLQGFLKWQPEDRYKYEWNKVAIEKTEHLKQLEFFVIKALLRLFAQTAAYLSDHELITEGDVFTSPDQLRKPNLAYYTNEQINKAAKGENQIPAFIIEIVSTNDARIQNVAKVQEYFMAGRTADAIQVVWLVMPAVKQVHIYQSPKNVEICLKSDSCSAAPVLPDFLIKVDSLFSIPQL